MAQENIFRNFLESYIISEDPSLITLKRDYYNFLINKKVKLSQLNVDILQYLCDEMIEENMNAEPYYFKIGPEISEDMEVIIKSWYYENCGIDIILDIKNFPITWPSGSLVRTKQKFHPSQTKKGSESFWVHTKV